MLNYSKAYYIATVRKTISNNEILNHLRKKVLHYSYIMTTAMGNTKETRDTMVEEAMAQRWGRAPFHNT